MRNAAPAHGGGVPVLWVHPEGGIMVRRIGAVARSAGKRIGRVVEYIRTYPDRGTPPPYQGSKFRSWKDGVEVADDIN